MPWNLLKPANVLVRADGPHHIAIAGEGEGPLEPGRHLGEEEDQGVGATAVTGAGTQQTIVLRELTLNFSSQTYPWIYWSLVDAYSILLQGHYENWGLVL